MSLTYPYNLVRNRILHCHLPTDADFDRMAEDLRLTIEASVFNPNHVWTIEGLITQMAQSVNAPEEGFHIHRKSTSLFYIRIPNGFNPAQVVSRVADWAHNRGIELKQYEDECSPFFEHTYLVRIKIINFPLNFWEDKFFKLAVAGFGEFIYSIQQDEQGNDRSAVRVWIYNRDPLTIPEFVILDFHEKWEACQIMVEDWVPNGWQPPPLWPGVDEIWLAEQIQLLAGEDNRVTTSYLSLLSCHIRMNYSYFRLGPGQHTVEEVGFRCTQAYIGQSDMHPYCTPSLQEKERESQIFQSQNQGKRDCFSGGFAHVETNLVHAASFNAFQMGKTMDKKQKPVRASIKGKLDTCIFCQVSHAKAHRSNGTKKLFHHTDIGTEGVSNLAQRFFQTELLRSSGFYWPQSTLGKSERNCVIHKKFTGEKPSLLCTSNSNLKPFNISLQKITQNSKNPHPQISIPTVKTSNNSILGPHPFSILLQESRMEHFKDFTDDQLVEYFASMSSIEERAVVQIPEHATNTLDWERCCLLRVVSERVARPMALAETMVRWWGVYPKGELKYKGENLFLAQFENDADMMKVMDRCLALFQSNHERSDSPLWGEENADQIPLEHLETRRYCPFQTSEGH